MRIGDVPLGREREDGREPFVVEAKRLRARMQLDPACSRVECAGCLLDRLLGEIEPCERDEHAVRGPRGFQRAVVRGPEGRLAVGLVEAERERARDAVLREESK